MQEQRLPINGPSFLNSDDETGMFGDFSPYLVNGYLDDLKKTHRWPGTEELVNIGNTLAITGLYWWSKKKMVIVVDESGNVYKITDVIGNYTNLTGTALTGNFPPTFVDDGDVVIIANGGPMVYTDGYATTAAIADTDAPTSVTHVALLHTYIIAKDYDTDTFYYSAVGDYTSWAALDFATAEANPDVTRSLIVHNEEILHLGAQSIENYYDDGSTPFARNSGAHIDVGCGATYSATKFANTVWFLNNSGIVSNLTTVGRSYEIPGKPVEKYIHDLGTIDDAVAFGANIVGRNFYVINFLTANKSLALDISNGNWYQVGKWNVNTAEFDAFIGRCHCYCEDWNIHLLGSRLRNGSIYKWSGDIYDEDGDPLRIIRRTGNVNHGTNKRKRSGRLYFHIKRGQGDPTGTEPQMSVKIRGDNKLLGHKRVIGLGNAGDSDIVQVESNAFKGIYRNRQWNFSFSDAVEFVMAEATEEVVALGR